MKLKRELTLLDVYCIATGAMISSGLFILPGLAHAQAGPAVIFSYFLAGVLALMGMLSEAELVSAMPKAGGSYFFVMRSMGPVVGTVNGLMTWFSLSLKSAFALVGMAAFMELIISTNIYVISLVLCGIFIITNIIGIKEAGKLQIVLVAGLLVLLVIYIAFGFPNVNIHYLAPFAPHGFYKILSTTGLVFVSYGGLLKITSIAEEVKNPSRTLPLGMLLSLATVIILYTLTVFVTSGVLGSGELDHSLTPISDGAFVFLGKKGMILLGIAAILAFISTANAGIMAASRYPLALARDELIPKQIAVINEKFKTPHYAILITGLFITIALFLKLKILVEVASTALILTYIFSCLSVIIMRESHVQNYQPQFKCPLYPWVQIIGIAGFCILIYEMGIEALIASTILICAGLFSYWFYGKIRATREYALLHLIRRITSKEITTHSLESELKEIIRERDNIIEDRFDKIIENCIIVDLDKSMNLHEFFSLVAEKMCKRINMELCNYLQLLFDREKESSTVIASGIAIPHIIIDGENTFDILLARCIPGITFSETAHRVDTVFILAGTRDERNFHLRALSAIAQIIQDPHFHKRWRAAKNIEDLRDIVLLGKRKR
ncbi:amino acid permease [bacterium]|nr:amino acid permease [bacterium]